VQRDRNLACRIDHVRVGERVAIRRDNHTAAPTPAAANVDYAWRHPFDHVNDGLRVRVEKRARWIRIGSERVPDFGRH
jgi:hypothetical protein